MSKSGYTCVRQLFCWLNVLLWVAGCGVLGVGIWLRMAYEGYANLLPQYALLSADSLTIFVGTVMFISAFFGCCGSWFQNRCMLVTYFSLVVCMFLGEFLMGSLAFVFRDSLDHTFREELRDGIAHHYNLTVPQGLVTIWDTLQTEFKCCGVMNYEDWYMIDAWPVEKWVPRSCCFPAARFHDETGTSCGKTGNPELWHRGGCSDEVYKWFIGRLHIVGIVGMVVAFIQLFGLISSMLLFCTVKHKRTSQTYKSYDMS